MDDTALRLGYEGESEKGLPHGEGILYVKGGQFQGTWASGNLVLGGFIFEDGLQHKNVDEQEWRYCSELDPRFYSEIQLDVPQRGPYPFPTPSPENYDLVPHGYYDTLEGYFDPKKSSIFDYKSKEELRVVNQVYALRFTSSYPPGDATRDFTLKKLVKLTNIYRSGNYPRRD